jgi:hypothetical protein
MIKINEKNQRLPSVNELKCWPRHQSVADGCEMPRREVTPSSICDPGPRDNGNLTVLIDVESRPSDPAQPGWRTIIRVPVWLMNLLVSFGLLVIAERYSLISSGLERVLQFIWPWLL